MSNNKSQAMNHKVNQQIKQQLQFQSGNQLAWLKFLQNINSKEYTIDSNNLQIDFISFDQDMVILGIKTPRTVAIVQLQTITEKKVQLLYQMELEESWIQKNQISCFKFLKNAKLPNINDLRVILGFNTGAIRIYKTKDSQFLMGLNLIQNKESSINDIWMKKKVIKLCLAPTFDKNQIVLALFEQGTIVEFSLNNISLSSKILKEIQEFFRNFSFQQIKSINIQKFQDFYGKKTNQHPLFRFQTLNDNEFTHMSLQLNNRDANPIAIYKFECTSVNELEILPLSPLDYTNEHKKDYQDQDIESLIIAFTGLDGYFRIIELKQTEPQFSFRSDYGGFNSFAFNKNHSMVSLAGQDDTTYVISFDQKITWLKLIGHCSFISRSVFNQVDEDTIRVISGSYDGHMSFTELNQDLFTQQRVSLTKTINRSNQRIVGRPDNRSVTLEVDNKLLMNTDGICYTGCHQNYLTTINFDGCITIFNLSDHQNEEEEQMPQSNK